MRELLRISRIVSLILKMWSEAPDLRLGQFLYNYAGFDDSNYQMEDDVIEANLIASYNKYFGIHMQNKFEEKK